MDARGGKGRQGCSGTDRLRLGRENGYKSRMPTYPALSRAKTALIRELTRDRKVREAERVFVLEGVRPVHELLASRPQALRELVVTPRWLEKHEAEWAPLFEQARVPVFLCREAVFETLSDLTTSAGLLAVVRMPEWNQEDVLQQPRLLGVYGEGLQDPANVGAIVRTAAAFNLSGLWLTAESADVFNPKVVRATAGTLLTLPVFSVRDVTVLTTHGCALLAAERPGTGSRRIREIRSIPARSIIAVGNESRGLSAATLDQARLRFHIPINPTVESLNVAVSTAVAAFYFSGLPRESGETR